MTEPKIAALHLLGRRSEQQDAFMYGPLQSGVVIALADGHGVNGGEAARFAVSQAVEATRANDGHPQSLGEIFLTIHRDITSQIRYGGTTLTLAMLRNGHLLTTAYVGDSEAWIFESNKLRRLTIPHRYKAHRYETQRLDEGEYQLQIYNNAILLASGACLAVTRALGDAEFDPYVLHTPEVRTIKLAGTERFLLVASDGFWELATKRKNWRHSLEDTLRASLGAENAINMIEDSLSDRKVNDNCTLVLVML